jgi:hypothetical protein
MLPKDPTVTTEPETPPPPPPTTINNQLTHNFMSSSHVNIREQWHTRVEIDT